MPRAKLLRTSLLSLLVAGLLVACAQLMPASRQPSSSPTAAPEIQSSNLLVAAAASLQSVLQDISPLYTQVNPSQTISYTFASSGALQRQIEQGAPVDIFISAASQQINALNEKGLLIPDTIKDLLTNQLVLIVPKSATETLSEFQQLTQPRVRRIAIGEPRSVPAGQYAAEVLENLGILEQVQPKLVLGNNVRSVLAGVESGDVDAGIVYLTDAKNSDRVVIAAVAEEYLHSPIRYSMAVLASSQSPDAAQQYIDFLQSPTARAVFEHYGFGVVDF